MEEEVKIQENKNKIQRLIKETFIISLLIIAAFWIFNSVRDYNYKVQSSDVSKIKTDTVLVKEIHHYHETINNTEKHIPYKVLVQGKRDTIWREQLEKGKIVSNVEVNSTNVNVKKVDSTGVVTEDRHEIPKNSNVVIDHEGNVKITEDKKAKRKEKINKILNRAADVLIAVGSFWIGSKF